MKNRMYVILLLYIFLLTVNYNTCSAQQDNSLTIKGSIDGLYRQGTVQLSSLMGKIQRIPVKNGQFTATVRNFAEGEPITLSIDSLDGTTVIIAEQTSNIVMNTSVQQWPSCIFLGSAQQEMYKGFENKIQKPFNAELANWSKARKQKTDTSSQEYRFAETKYNLAATIYQKQTLIWIIEHPHSLYTPQLILNWWPKSDWKNIYGRLSQRVKESCYGKELKNQIRAQHLN